MTIPVAWWTSDGSRSPVRTISGKQRDLLAAQAGNAPLGAVKRDAGLLRVSLARPLVKKSRTSVRLFTTSVLREVRGPGGVCQNPNNQNLSSARSRRFP
jgi:hypothetical protein